MRIQELHKYIENGQEAEFFKALKKYLKGKRHTINDSDGNDRSTLMLAASYGSVSIVQFLIEHKADVNAQNILESTPLIEALSAINLNSKLKIMQALLNAKADIHAQDWCGDDALSEAAFSGEIEVVSFLVCNGANPQRSLSKADDQNMKYKPSRDLVYRVLQDYQQLVSSVKAPFKGVMTKHNNKIKALVIFQGEAIAKTPLPLDLAMIVLEYLSIDSQVREIFRQPFLPGYELSTKKNSVREKPTLRARGKKKQRH